MKMTYTYIFKFPDGKTEHNTQSGETREIEDIISESAKLNGGKMPEKKPIGGCEP